MMSSQLERSSHSYSHLALTGEAPQIPDSARHEPFRKLWSVLEIHLLSVPSIKLKLKQHSAAEGLVQAVHVVKPEQPEQVAVGQFRAAVSKVPGISGPNMDPKN